MKNGKILALALAVALTACSANQIFVAAPANYQQNASITLPIEKRYMQNGDFSVSSQTFASGKKAYSTYKIWYPKDMANSGKQYPLVIMANGTGTTFDKYESVFEHLASWGFVVIGNDDKSSWRGESSNEALNFAISLNDNPNSSFYRKIDTQKVGIAGHSQGGVAVINAVTRFDNSNRYKAVFGASTTKHELAQGLKWDYDISKVKAPYFAVSGTGVFDAGKANEVNGGIAPIVSMNSNFAKISPSVPQVMARLKKADHGEMLYKGNGYMVAWFMYHLQNDQQAGQAFIGNNAEIARNPLWQDVRIKGR